MIDISGTDLVRVVAPLQMGGGDVRIEPHPGRGGAQDASPFQVIHGVRRRGGDNRGHMLRSDRRTFEGCHGIDDRLLARPEPAEARRGLVDTGGELGRQSRQIDVSLVCLLDGSDDPSGMTVQRQADVGGDLWIDRRRRAKVDERRPDEGVGP